MKKAIIGVLFVLATAVGFFVHAEEANPNMNGGDTSAQSSDSNNVGSCILWFWC